MAQRGKQSKNSVKTQAMPTFFSVPIVGLLGQALVLLLLFAAASSDVNKYAAVAVLAVAGVALVVKLVDRGCGVLASPNPMAVVGYMAVFGVTSIWAVAPKFAMSEYSKLLLAFGVYLLVMLLTTGRRVGAKVAIHGICFSMSVVAALIGAASISVSFGDGLGGLLKPITTVFLTPGGVESGVRMTSILQNPNCYAGVMGLAIVATLVLLLNGTTALEQGVALFLLTFNCVAFLLAFSMGASASIAVGFLLMLLLMPGEKKGFLFASLFLTMVLTLVGVGLAFPLLEESGGTASLAIGLGCGVAATLLGQLVMAPLVVRCAGHKKLVYGTVGTLVVLVLVVCGLALTMTGEYALQSGESLRRSAYPEAGTYTLKVESDTPVLVTIESQDERETIIHDSTRLYSGEADGATFQVPEGSLVTYFTFSSDTATTLFTALWTGEQGEGSLALDYKLMPDFIANRLQGLLANENAIQRTAFFRDGMELFGLAPLTGRGLGGFENGVFSVQSFYYETKYAHNHLIQTLCDGGILGCAAFLALLGTSGYILIGARRREDTAVTASVLLGGLLFVIVHSMVELVFSNEYYLLFVLLFFAMGTLLTYSGEEASPRRSGLALVVSAVSLALCVGFGAVWAASISVESHEVQSGETVYEAFDRFIQMDYFGRNDVKLSYVYQAMNDGGISAQNLAQADEYAAQLCDVESNSVGGILIQYYFFRDEPEQAFDVALHTAEYIKSSQDRWNDIFHRIGACTTVGQYLEEPEVYAQGLNGLLDYFEQVQSEQLDTLTLDETTLDYLSKMEQLMNLEEVTSEALAAIWGTAQ